MIKIDSDALFITNRLKQIEEGYFIVYSTKKHRYELHNKNQKGSSYCLTCPFAELDERFIELALETRSENKEKLFKKIEKHNQKIKQQNAKKIIEKMGEYL